MPSRQKLDQLFIDLAVRVGSMSYATRNKVGAVLVKDENVQSIGYNGLPKGYPNEEIEFVAADGTLTTNPMVLHAESNAIAKCAANSHSSTKGATLYVTLSPCLECSKLIIQTDIARVVYKDTYRDLRGVAELKARGIEVVQLPQETEDASRPTV